MNNLKLGDIKVGDKVRVINDEAYHPKGFEYIVSQISNRFNGVVAFMLEHDKGVYLDNLELVEPHSKGANKMQNYKEIQSNIEAIHFNETKRTTVIRFKNGDVVKATCAKDTQFSKYGGFVAAMMKYQLGTYENIEKLIKKKEK